MISSLLPKSELDIMLTDYQVSISRLIVNLKDGDPAALEQLWAAYFRHLIGVAQKKMGEMPKQERDEEDAIISVFNRLWERMVNGQVEGVQDRNDLWKLLVCMTRQKIIDYKRTGQRQKRGGGNFENIEIIEIADTEPSPDFVVLLKDDLQYRLNRLGDKTLQRIVVLRLQGESNAEIAAQLHLSVRTIERKLKLVADEWGRDLEDA